VAYSGYADDIDGTFQKNHRYFRVKAICAAVEKVKNVMLRDWICWLRKGN
jgi:hypothetical protein